MRFFFALGVAGLVLVGCGGSTSKDSSSGGSSGSGASSGSSGTGASSGFGGSGNYGGGGVGNTGGGPDGGMGGVGNYGGGPDGGMGGAGGGLECCSSDSQCPIYNSPPGSDDCVNGVCKDTPPAGTCWDDDDCGGVPGSCQGGSVCPCGMDCYAADTLGKCVVGPNCCATDSDCTQKPNYPLTCVAGNCEKVPPSGQCWTDNDCNGGVCSGACVCPCGSICACGGQMGWCTSTVPACCTSSAACGPGAVCANNVCKKSEPPYCWADEECPNGQKCVGATVCPCGALCAIADNPGKCQ